MKFEWIEEGDGRYRVQFFDMDEKKVFDIKITDYSDPYWQQSDLERKIRRECCYDVIFYAGHRKSYSDNPNYETEYGFQGKSEHDIIYIRELCKNFIADSYVFDYEKALRGLQKRKAMSDWFLASGYTGDYEGKQEYKRSGLAGKLKSLEDQMFRLSAELKSIKSVGFSKPVDTALEAETNIPITSNSSAQPDLPEESVPVLITPSKTSEVAQTETTDFDALFGDWGFDSFDNTDEPGFFESAEETGTSFQETATVSETSAALSAGELAQKSLSERISNDPVIKEKLLSAEWITQEENLLLKVLPEYKEDILLFIAASGIKNITIC